MVIVVTLLALTVIIVSFAHYTYQICFHASKNRTEDPYAPLAGEQYAQVSELIARCTAIMDKIPFHWIKIHSFDQTELYGRYYHKKDGAPLMILFHGYRSCALRDCAGGFTLAQKLGFNVLAVDQRAHGRSSGVTITFGVLERYDCLYWAEYAEQHLSCGAPILLSGLSMGAATVLMAAQLPLPEDVVCILADCPYSSPKGIIQKVCKDRKIPPKLAYPFILLGAKLFGRFNLNAASALTAVPHSKIPILLYHGEDDRFVPCQMSREISNANTECSYLYTFPEAGHGLSYMVDPVRYEQLTLNFLCKIPELSVWLTQQEK